MRHIRLERSGWLLILGSAILGAGCSTSTSSQPPLIAPPHVTVLTTQDSLPATSGLNQQATQVISIQALQAVECGNSDARLQTARREYVQLRFEESLAMLREIELAFSHEGCLHRDFDALGRLYLLRGMNDLALGRTSLAHNSMLAAARLRPKHQLDPTYFPPKVIEVYETLRSQVNSELPAMVNITTAPAAAKVFVNSDPRGLSPTTVRHTTGRHYLRLERLGNTPLDMEVEFKVSDTQTLHLNLKEAPLDYLAQQVFSLSESEFEALDTDDRTMLFQRFKTNYLIRLNQNSQGHALVLEPTRQAIGSTTLRGNLKDINKELKRKEDLVALANAPTENLFWTTSRLARWTSTGLALISASIWLLEGNRVGDIKHDLEQSNASDSSTATKIRSGESAALNADIAMGATIVSAGAAGLFWFAWEF